MFFLCTLPSAIDSWTNRRAWSLYERHADALPLSEADDYAMMCLTYLWFVRDGTSVDGGLKSIIWSLTFGQRPVQLFNIFPLETRFLKGDSMMMLCWWFCTWDLECLTSTAPGRDWLKKKRRPNYLRWLEPPPSWLLQVAKVGPPGFVQHFLHSAIVGGYTVPYIPFSPRHCWGNQLFRSGLLTGPICHIWSIPQHAKFVTGFRSCNSAFQNRQRQRGFLT